MIFLVGSKQYTPIHVSTLIFEGLDCLEPSNSVSTSVSRRGIIRVLSLGRTKIVHIYVSTLIFKRLD